MKKILFVLALVAFSMTLFSCQTKQKKAEKFVKQDLSQVLYDFDSYQPISTIVTEAKDIPINNEKCVDKALDAIANYSLACDYLGESRSAMDLARIWGAPTYYSSSYSDSKYYSNISDAIDNGDKANFHIKKRNEAINELKTLMHQTNSSKTIGYCIDHKFRCRTKGGDWTIGHYRYVVDKKMKQKIFYLDEEDSVTSFIQSVENNTYEKCDDTLDLSGLKKILQHKYKR